MGIEPPALPSIRWDEPPEGPVLVLLDQTRLPAEEVGLVCRDVPALVRAIQTLAVRGAPLLGIAGAYGVALAAVRGYDVAEAAGLLEGARPTAVNLGYGVRRAAGVYWAALDKGADPQRAAAVALAEAKALHREDAEASRRMAQYGLALLDELLPGDGHQLLTHCNSGALVSGGEGTAFAVALRAHRAGRLRRLWVDETRPLLQGARLTAYEAARNGMAYSLLTDNAAGSLFAAGRSMPCSSAPIASRRTGPWRTKSGVIRWRCLPNTTMCRSLWWRRPRPWIWRPRTGRRSLWSSVPAER